MIKYEIETKDKIITSELLIKKSRFIAKVYYVDSTDKIQDILSKTKMEHNDAKHIVYAYRLENTAKFSDDKEPTGTAGKPIYNILEKENLINVLVVVIRYFGGILLGAGPLSRAYSMVAKNALKLCSKKEFIEYINKEIVCEYKEEEKVKRTLMEKEYIIQSISRTDKVTIKYLEKK